MYLKLLQNEYVEKILRDEAGRLVRITFYVYEHGGRMRGRVTNIQVLEKALPQNEILALPGSIHTHPVASEISFLREIVSPYFDSSILYTLGSKPRAPSFR